MVVFDWSSDCRRWTQNSKLTSALLPPLHDTTSWWIFSCEDAAQQVHLCLRLSVCGQNWNSSYLIPFPQYDSFWQLAYGRSAWQLMTACPWQLIWQLMTACPWQLIWQLTNDSWWQLIWQLVFDSWWYQHVNDSGWQLAHAHLVDEVASYLLMS